jgi:hypothetical protein
MGRLPTTRCGVVAEREPLNAGAESVPVAGTNVKNDPAAKSFCAIVEDTEFAYVVGGAAPLCRRNDVATAAICANVVPGKIAKLMATKSLLLCPTFVASRPLETVEPRPCPLRSDAAAAMRSNALFHETCRRLRRRPQRRRARRQRLPLSLCLLPSTIVGSGVR